MPKGESNCDSHLLGGGVYVLKRGAIKCTANYLCWIHKGEIGDGQPSFARALGVVAGLIVAIHLMRPRVGLMGKCRVKP